MPALASWLHAQRHVPLKLGLYTSAGNQTCSSGGRAAPVPGSRGHYGADAQAFASWGVDAVKLDWCGDIKHEIFQGAQAHKAWAAALNATGRPIYNAVVAGYFFLGKDVARYANSWRPVGFLQSTFSD